MRVVLYHSMSNMDSKFGSIKIIAIFVFVMASFAMKGIGMVSGKRLMKGWWVAA